METAENLKRLNLTQKEFAERIGIAQQTISRWMGNVQMQSRAIDNLMRLVFRPLESDPVPRAWER